MKALWFGLGAGVVLAITATAASSIDGLIQPLVAVNSPGVAVMVRREGHTVFQRGYGVADLNSRHAIGPTTNFRLASFTKQFTAMAIMLLVHDGKLTYDTRLIDIFADFPAYGHAITVRQLLTHTAGLPDYEDVMGPQWTTTHQILDTDVLELLKRQSSGKFAPGTSWSYSNSGYVVLGLIAAKLSGEPFPQFLEQRIFTPLHMTSTLAYVKEKNEIRNRAYGYSKNSGGKLVDSDQSSTSATLGDGGIYSNLVDLARWDDALRTHALFGTQEMPAAYEPIKLADGSVPFWPKNAGDNDSAAGTPVAYGFGWFLDPYKGHTRAWHSGTTCGFRTVIDRFTAENLSVVILANRTDIDPTNLALRVADTYLKTNNAAAR